MSLFPAYANNETNNENTEAKENELSFSSYKIDAPSTSNVNKFKEASSSKTQTFATSSIEKSIKNRSNTKYDSEKSSTEIVSSDSDSSSKHRRRKKKKREKRHKKDKSEKEAAISLKDSFNDENFIIDKSREVVFLKVAKISRPAVSKYRYINVVIGDKMFQEKRKRKSRRYFDCKYLIKQKQDEDEESKELEKQSENSQQNQAEDDISRKTAFFNQSLGKDPFDVDLWLQYIRFQDNVWLFEKTYKKGSIAKGGRVTAERKLAILDKALTHNPNNDTLSREKVLIAETVYPADELSGYLKGFVEKNPSNIILWQGYIESTQCSMAHCNTPAVISLYNKCLSKLHQLRRGSSLEKSLLEERILSMLYKCGLFLRQAGLWEQMWTLLQLYLELNLASHDKSKFRISFKYDDKQLVELEEVILESQLPLHELWLRVEKLRESCHWLPWTETQPCEDPQRMVFIDDVSDLIHPITSPGNSFRLTVMILTLLKTPLLPCRHSTIQELGLDYVPWALDTIETLYPVFFPLYPINLDNNHLLKDAIKLAVGPQYLKTHPGQEEYLNFLVDLMKNCGDCLQGVERTAIFVWWFRFERLLVVLSKNGRFKMPTGRVKRLKSAVKDFLRDDSNRNNVVFYREYSLLEYELDNPEAARKILLTAISMISSGNPVVSVMNYEDQTALCCLYRTLVELFLRDKNSNEAIRYLVALITGSTDSSSAELSQEVIEESLKKYQHILTELLREPQKSLTVAEHFLPDFLSDFIICYGWFLYLVRTPFEAGTMVENSLSALEQSKNEVAWRREILFEWYVTLFYKTCTERLGGGMFGLFSDILHRALKCFPNNLYLLAVACKEQSSSGCVGKPWWKLSNLLSNCGHAMPALFLVIMANQQLSKIKDEWDDFDIGNPVSTLSTFQNRILSLFLRLTKTDMCTKRCGLLWRLYLQYLYSYSNSEACRNAYYSAVEECPWLKALYIDAAIYIPTELPQIQDLIIEKQLRIHVTPEELDVLRS